MAFFESGERRVTYMLRFFRCIFPLLVANIQCADSIFLWTAPPPAWNQTVGGSDPANIQTAVIPVLNGSTNYHVRWNYTLLEGQSITFTFFSVVGESSDRDIGFVFKPGTPSESTTVNNGYDFQTRFKLQSNSEFSTLTINTVTERENITFRCKFQVGSDQWAYNIRIKVTVPPDITHISDNQTVIKNDNLTLNCIADGHPPPDITWTNVSDDSVVTFPLAVKIEDEGYYRCTANNSIGSPATKDVFIAVLYPPNINHISGNQTVNEGDEVTMNCTADGKPTPNITWTIRDIKKHFGSSFPLAITGKQDEGNYTCTADNGIGSQSDNVSVTVEKYRPINTKLTTPKLTVVLNESFTLTCSSQANPPAKYRFLREQQSLFNTTAGNNSAVNTTSVSERIKQVTYSCTPFNDLYGDGPTGTITVTVLYSPSATGVGWNTSLPMGSRAFFPCPVDGNPEPNITWYKGSDASGTVIYRGKVLDFPQIKESDTEFYTCSASNSLGTPVKITHYLLVELFSPSTTSKTTPEGTMEVVRRITLAILNKDCDNFLEEEFRKEVMKILEHLGLKDVKIEVRCGSVIVDLVLRFNQSVSESDVISVLKTAAEQKKFTNFDVDPSSIKATEESTQEPVCKETFFKNKDCSTIVWKIVILAIAGVVVIAFVVGIVTWWIQKRRKCRKDPRIHHSEERLHGNVEDSAYSQVKHGYAGTGPRTNGTGAVALQQRAAADGRDAASHQQEATASPTYAEVDKSKKKKKEEKLDYTYAEVDKSKKSKKKPKPGEMIYADLEDINGPRPMPTVSTSPQPQAPIKRPEPYENTPYADITQFLKGDATLPQSDSNQGTELQPQGASKDEGGAGGEDRNTTM